MLEISWQPLRSNRISFEILLTKECGMLAPENLIAAKKERGEKKILRHFVWKKLGLVSSALLSHDVCKQYDMFECTQI